MFLVPFIYNLNMQNDVTERKNGDLLGDPWSMYSR